MSSFINLTKENLEVEHLCCAIADKKHQIGVESKRSWLAEGISEGHVFRKLNEKGKVFIEYELLALAGRTGNVSPCGRICPHCRLCTAKEWN